MHLTIVICTYNRHTKLYRLLDSLERQHFCDFIVYIIDASDLFLSINTAKYKFEIKHIKAIQPNLPLQRWQGASKCKTELIGFLDDDVELSENYLEKIFVRFKTNHEITGITGWMVNIPVRKRSIKTKLRQFLSGISKKNQGKISACGFAIPFTEIPKSLYQTSFLPGGNMFYRKNIFINNCYLPWLYELYRRKQGRGEDLAVSGLLSKKGYKLYLEPDIICYHHEEGGGSAFSVNGINKGIADSYCRYKIYKMISKRWNLYSWYIFIRYFLINFFVPGLLNIKYQKGLLIGIKRIINEA